MALASATTKSLRQRGSVKQGKIKGVAVAVITATLLLSGVDTSSAKPMRPAAIKQFTFVRAASYNDKNDMRPYLLVLTPDKLDMKGRCNPKNPYNPGLKVWKNLPTKTVSVSCSGRKVVAPSAKYLGMYRTIANRIGTKVARMAGVSKDEHGDTTLLWVNNRKAVLKFSAPETGQVSRPVKSIVFLNHGRPKVRRYE